MKEFFLAYFTRLSMMANEDNLDIPVSRRDELIEQEEEAASQVFLHRVHRTRGIHDTNDYSVGILAGVSFEMPVAQVVLMEWEAALDLGLKCHRRSISRLVL